MKRHITGGFLLLALLSGVSQAQVKRIDYRHKRPRGSLKRLQRESGARKFLGDLVRAVLG